MSLTTCPDCGHPAGGHTVRCWHARCACRRASTTVFLPDNLDAMALRYAAARLERYAERHLPGRLADERRGAARYLRGLAR